MSNKLRQFQSLLTEGISQEDLADSLMNRLQMRYPDILDKYGYDAVEDAVNDVASFHAGAEELGSSDISIMLKEIIKSLESEKLDELAMPYSEFKDERLWQRVVSSAGHKITKGSDGSIVAIDNLGHHAGGFDPIKKVWYVKGSSINEEEVTLPKWEIGLTVLVKHIGQKGQIASLNGDHAIVTVDNRQYRVPLSGLKRFPLKGATEGAFYNPRRRYVDPDGPEPERMDLNLPRYVPSQDEIEAEKEHKAKKRAELDRTMSWMFPNKKGVDEGLGTPYPGTYEQENNMFKRKGPRQTPKIAFEDQVNELSTEKLAQYKTAAGKDASAADKAGDFKRGDKRFSGIVKATKKQFANDAKQVKESSILKGLRNVK